MISLTHKDAKLLALNGQGLLNSPESNDETLNCLSYVQIDTISVTERAHHHVFYTRNKHYKKADLDALVKQKKAFEYWSHAAAYLPIKDFRYSLYPKSLYLNGQKHWFPRDKKVEQYVIDRIKSEGPLQSKDFENPRQKNHEWYEWKPAKIALTNLFMAGEIMIKERQGFQKVFDLSERVIPDYNELAIPTIPEYCAHLILNAVNAHGLISLEEISYLRKGVKPTIKKIIASLVEQIELMAIDFEGQTYYSTPALIESVNGLKFSDKMLFLSPFDNLVIQRKRLKRIFDFDYQIECYVPEKKRKFGYYTIPIFYRDQFIGRFDAKANRKESVFLLKNLWMEAGVKVTDEIQKKLGNEFKSFAQFCGVTNLQVAKSNPKFIKDVLTSL